MKFVVVCAAVSTLFSATLQLPPAMAQAPPPPREQQRHAPPSPRNNSVTSDLDALSQSAEEVFDLAMNGKLERSAKKLDTLKKQAAALSYISDDGQGLLLPHLTQTVSELDQAVMSKSRIDAMRFANRITLITATVGMQYRQSIPTEVSLLDYNGRELTICSETKRSDRLPNIVMRMHLTWQALMPKLIEHNGTRELKRFSETMGHLENARTTEEYGRLSRQAAAELDAIKGVFTKSR